MSVFAGLFYFANDLYTFHFEPLRAFMAKAPA